MFKDFEQKRRDRAIQITDTAIDKVPCTRLPGFTSDQNKVIQLLHKRVLIEAKALNEQFANNLKKMILECTNSEKKIVSECFRQLRARSLLERQDLMNDILKSSKINDKVKNIVKNYVDNDMEAGILLDTHSLRYMDNSNVDEYIGNVYWIIDGKIPRRVRIEDNLNAYRKMVNSYKNQLILMHNHPSTGTFSGEDLKSFCAQESIYAMTVVGNDGSVYILIKGAYFDRNSVEVAYYNLINNKYVNRKNNATLAMREILSNAEKYNLIYIKGRKKA